MSDGPLALLNTHVLGAVLRAVEVAMRAENVPDEQTQRVINVLVYGDRRGLQPDPEERVAFTPSPVPEDKLVDLMDALERSVAEAKAEREATRLRGPRLVPRRDPHLCWRVHPGTEDGCQLPLDHDVETDR